MVSAIQDPFGSEYTMDVPPSVVRELYGTTSGDPVHLEVDTVHNYCFDPKALRQINRSVVDFFVSTIGAGAGGG